MNAFNRSQIETSFAASVNRAVTSAFSMAVIASVGALTFAQFLTLAA